MSLTQTPPPPTGTEWQSVEVGDLEVKVHEQGRPREQGEEAKYTSSLPSDTLAGVAYEYEPSFDKMEETTHQGKGWGDSKGHMKEKCR